MKIIQFDSTGKRTVRDATPDEIVQHKKYWVEEMGQPWDDELNAPDWSRDIEAAQRESGGEIVGPLCDERAADLKKSGSKCEH
jgi:hypothetical protein